MKVNFNGMRNNATQSMNNLQSILKDIIAREEVDEDMQEELIDRYNEAAMSVDVFNCLEDDNVEGDFDVMDNLNIARLQLQDEDEDV